MNDRTKMAGTVQIHRPGYYICRPFSRNRSGRGRRLLFTARELFIVTVQGDIESFAAGESPRMESCSQGTRSKCAFPPCEKTQEVLQKYAGDDTKKCNAPVQKNVPPHTENCRTNTYITTENTDIESINLIHQSDSEDNREKRDNDMMDVMDEANAYMEIIKENIE